MKGKHTRFGKIPVWSISMFVAQRYSHICGLQSVQDGGWSYFEVCFFLIGVLYIVGAYFLSLFTFPCQGFGWRFGCLRINYFNLTLIVIRIHPAATHLPLQPTFKERSCYMQCVCVSVWGCPQTVSFLIKFLGVFFLLALGDLGAWTRWFIANLRLHAHGWFMAVILFVW